MRHSTTTRSGGPGKASSLMADASNRRPLASRDTGWARTFTHWLAATSITPNQISMASIAAAGIAGACFWLSGQADIGIRAVVLIAAAAFCQVRLLFNLFDGMVAIEAGKHAPDGGFWNEFPDRIADMLIFVGAGLGVGEPALGWAAAGFAVLTDRKSTRLNSSHLGISYA